MVHSISKFEHQLSMAPNSHGHQIFRLLGTLFVLVNDTNSAAERGVKLTTDLATKIATDPTHTQHQVQLQGVKKHRQKYSDFNKIKLSRPN